MSYTVKFLFRFDMIGLLINTDGMLLFHYFACVYFQVVRMMIVVLLVFFVCWTPQQVIVLYDTYRSQDEAVNIRF